MPSPSLSLLHTGGCNCTGGILPAKDGKVYPELYIWKHGGFFGCEGFIDDKLYCGCARACPNLGMSESTISGLREECPPYDGPPPYNSQHHCTDDFLSDQLAGGAEMDIYDALEAISGVITNEPAGAEPTVGAAVSAATNTTLRTAVAVLTLHRHTIRTKAVLINQALDLIDMFEASVHGPLFVKAGCPPHTIHGSLMQPKCARPGFLRVSVGAGDQHEIDRAMWHVQQLLMDYVYQEDDIAYSLPPCRRSIYEGRGWKTSTHFPGPAPAPEDSSVVHNVRIDASKLRNWGWSKSFSTSSHYRPTGLYLSPGMMAIVTVPASMVNTGFTIQVGVHVVSHVP